LFVARRGALLLVEGAKKLDGGDVAGEFCLLATRAEFVGIGDDIVDGPRLRRQGGGILGNRRYVTSSVRLPFLAASAS
jgi:hypothetical protein